MFRSIYRAALPAATLVLAASIAGAQQLTPEEAALRLNRLSERSPESLAPKAGGPTERIEVQTTDDHRDYVVKVYRLREAVATELYRNILFAVQQEDGTVERILLPPDANGDSDSLLVVTAPEWMIPYLDQTISALDVPGIEDAAWGTSTTFIRPRHRRPSELADLIAASVASGVQIFAADDSRNVLYLEDTPSWWPAVLGSLEFFDQPADMVEAHIRIYEIRDADLEDVGLDWDAWKQAASGGSLDFTWDNSANPNSYELDLTSINASLSVNPNAATQFLNYVANNGNARILTDTTVTLVNGEQGVIDSTTTIPYVAYGEGGNLIDAMDFTAGVTVELTPTIGTESVEFAVSAVVSNHTGFTPVQNMPIISSSSVNTILNLTPEAAGLIGGLTRTTEAESRTGIPFLKDIPYVWPLFAREVSSEERSQILISIMPRRVMTGSGAAIPVADAAPGEPHQLPATE